MFSYWWYKIKYVHVHIFKCEQNINNFSLIGLISVKMHFFLKICFIYLKVKVIDEMERDRSSILRLIAQMVTLAQNGPDRRQDPGISTTSSMWVQGPKLLGQIALLFQAHWQELDQKRSCHNSNEHPYWMPAPQVATCCIVPCTSPTCKVHNNHYLLTSSRA